MSAFVGSLSLVLLIALVGAAWRRLLRGLGEGHDVVVFAGVLVTMAVADLGGALTHDLRTGFALAVAAVLLAAVVTTRRPLPTLTTTPSWQASEYVAGGVVAALLAWCALGSWMWDEQSTHLPLAGAAARGVLPLQHPAFPGQPLRYHAGYAVAVGVVRAFTGLPLDLCADVVTIASVIALVIGVREVLRRFGCSAGHSAVGVIVVLCAGGPLAGLLADGWGAPLPGKGLLPTAWVNGATFPPLVVTNVLQHPQGLAMPVALAVVMLLAGRGPGTARLARVVAAACFVVALARIQILFSAFAGLLLLGVVAHDVVREGRSAVGAVLSLGVVGVAGGLALVVGGIGGGATDAIVVGAGYFAADGAGALVREGFAFGVSLLALPAALWCAWRRPSGEQVLLVGFGLLGALGVVVGNVAVYSRSWDIVKFFGVGFFFGHLALAVALGRVPRRWRLLVVMVSCWSGGFWLLRHGPLQGVVAPAARERPLDAVAVAVDDACGHLVAGRARVFSTHLPLWQVGWLVPGTSWQKNRDTMALLLDRQRVDDDVAAWAQARQTLAAPDLAAFSAEAVVVDDDAARRRAVTIAELGLSPICRAAGMTVFSRRGGT